MTVDLKLAGKTLTPAGRQTWATAATVSEDSTATNLADTFGGVGSINVSTDLLDNTMHLQGATVELTFNPDGGVRTGVVESISGSAGIAQISGSTNLRKLNRTINATVVTTTLGDALKQYLQKCGLSAAQYSIDSTIAARTGLWPGWSGNCWESIKELATVEQFDVGEIDGVITVAPLGQNTIDTSNNFQSTLSLSENIAGQQVETYFYTYSKLTNAQVYPPDTYDDTYGATIKGGWSKNVQVLSVTPGALSVTEVPLMASLSAVQQPICLKAIGPDYTGPSAYTVVTNDGDSPVDPADWTKRGGKITVQILPDTKTLRITVDAGQNLAAAAPYRICMTSGDGTDYSTLRIMGTGVLAWKQRLRMPTSTPTWMTDNDIASSTDCIFVRSQDQARRILRGQASAASRSQSSLNAGVGVIPLPFGKRAGAIIHQPEATYRVRTCSTSVGGSTLQADRYTTIADFNTAWAGKTIADFNAVWAGYAIRNVNSAPLLTSVPEPPQIPVLTGYGFSPYSTAPYGD